jgi:hypothetical protein
LEVSLDDVCRALDGLVEFSFDPEDCWINEVYLIPRPGITVTREHVENALSKWRTGQIGERDMVCWASLLLMSEVYEFDPKNPDFVGDSLTDIKYRDFPL